MTGALIGAAARTLAPMAANAAGTFLQGKMGETIGNHNLSEAEQLRARSNALNEDPTLQGNRAGNAVNSAQEGANARSMGREAFLNQMTQANKRADNEDQRATYDQDNAYRRGAQLADAYTQSAMNQANSNNQVLATMLGVSGQARR
jgi:hypothetical protein